MSTRWHYIKEPFNDADFVVDECRICIRTDGDILGEQTWEWIKFSEERFLQLLHCIADKDSTAIICQRKQVGNETMDTYSLCGPYDETEWLISECADIKLASDVIKGRTRI